MTLGMLAMAAASTLFLRSVGDRGIDPRMLFGANAGNLAQHLLTIAGCYELGAMALETARPDWAKHWRGFTSAIAVTLIITYRIGTQYRIPAPEFTLTGGPARTHQWLILMSVGATFLVLTASAIRRIRDDGPDERLSMIFLAYLGIAGAGCNAMVGALMIADPAVVASSYHRIATFWSIPALIFLGLAGIPGFASAWARRFDPH